VEGGSLPVQDSGAVDEVPDGSLLDQESATCARDRVPQDRM